MEYGVPPLATDNLGFGTDQQSLTTKEYDLRKERDKILLELAGLEIRIRRAYRRHP